MAKEAVNKVADDPADDLPTEYWHIVAEIDATIFCIEQAAHQLAGRSPIEKMIDESTGDDKDQISTLEYWSARLKLLTALLPKDDPHFKQSLKAK